MANDYSEDRLIEHSCIQLLQELGWATADVYHGVKKARRGGVALKGRNKNGTICHALSGLEKAWLSIPRAMPWARIFKPFRLLNGNKEALAVPFQERQAFADEPDDRGVGAAVKLHERQQHNGKGKKNVAWAFKELKLLSPPPKSPAGGGHRANRGF